MEQDLTLGAKNPGCFGLKESRGTDPETGLQLPVTDHRARAVRRAARGLSVRRLIERGLVESYARGRWRLTPKGFKAAKALWPDMLPPSKKAVAGQIRLATTIRSVVGGGNRGPKPRGVKVRTGKGPSLQKRPLRQKQGSRSRWTEVRVRVVESFWSVRRLFFPAGIQRVLTKC